MTILTPFDPSGCSCDNSDVAPGMLTINAALDALLDLVTPVDGTGIVPLPQASGAVGSTSATSACRSRVDWDREAMPISGISYNPAPARMIGR